MCANEQMPYLRTERKEEKHANYGKCAMQREKAAHVLPVYLIIVIAVCRQQFFFTL